MRSASSTPLTEAHIVAALRDCYDPEIRANIIELGLVHSISIATDLDAPGTGIPGVPPRYRVQVNLMPYPGSDSEAQIVALIQNRLAAFPNISRAEVQLIEEPRWTPDRVAPELRQRLSVAVASNQRSHDLVQIQTASAKAREDS
jgi:metal-sulfur cluster biosynthetic enzyme